MKTVKELKQDVIKRMGSCWGENAAIFFVSAGGIAAAFLAWLMFTDILRKSGAGNMPEHRLGIKSGAVSAAAALAVLWIAAKPFLYGVKWYRLQQVRGRSVHARSIFTCYGSWRRMGQIFRFSAVFFVRRLYFILPVTAALGAGIYIVLGIDPAGGGIGRAAAAAAILLLAGGLICLAVLLNRKFAAAPYLFVLDPKAPPKEIIDRSVRLAKGRGPYLSDALFAAAAWLPVCILVFPAVFVLPYGQTLYTAAINEVITAEN